MKIRRFVSTLLIVLALGLGLGGGAGVGFLAVPAQAQDTVEEPDYAAWEKVAQRAEAALQERRASNTALEQLRAELVGWRDQFLGAQDINKARIATLKNQIAALGPPPAEGGSEPAELTARRDELTAQLADLEAPRRRAEEAYSRADGLIRETDAIIRERQTASLFELKPSPANPVLWPEALAQLSDSLTRAVGEVTTAWASDALQKGLRDNLPLILAYLVVALVLLARGRGWMVRLTQRVQAGPPGAATSLRAFGVSLGQVILPVVGIYALVQALFFTGLLGFRSQLIADSLIPTGIAFFGARWLALRLLPRQGVRRGFLELPEPTAGRARRYAAGLGLLWGVDRLLVQLGEFESYDEATRVVLHFPLIALAGWLLFRFGRLLRANARDAAVEAAGEGAEAAEDAAAPGDWDFRARATDILGRALVAVGIAAPLVALVGYYSVASAVVFPTILSLGLLALVTVLAAVARDAYAYLTGADEAAARDALLPVLAGFGLVLLSLPVFALIWGARVSDLTELWARFQEGFQIGGTRISPTEFVTFAVVFAIGYVVTRIVQSTLKTSVLPKTKIDPGARNAMVSGIGYLGIFLAALIAISTAGIDLSSLAIVAGALSVGIGFGLQNIVSNFVSGIILLIERPITEGDWIEVGGKSGYVRDISVRSTRIETFDRTDVIVPNSDLVSGTVVNYTRGKLIGRVIVSVGVAYGTDTHKVSAILKEIAQAHSMVMKRPGPSVHFVGFGADSLDFQIRMILRDVNYSLTVKSDVHHEIVRRFAEEGIEIPFAQRDLWLRNPEALRPGRSEGSDGGDASAPKGPANEGDTT